MLVEGALEICNIWVLRLTVGLIFARPIGYGLQVLLNACECCVLLFFTHLMFGRAQTDNHEEAAGVYSVLLDDMKLAFRQSILIMLLHFSNQNALFKAFAMFGPWEFQISCRRNMHL